VDLHRGQRTGSMSILLRAEERTLSSDEALFPIPRKDLRPRSLPICIVYTSRCSFWENRPMTRNPSVAMTLYPAAA
jgi:hypothetical protein